MVRIMTGARLCRALALGIVAAGCLGLWGTPPAAAEATMPVGVGVSAVDVTPREPIRLAGYGSRETESEGVAQKLWAKALAIGSDRADAGEEEHGAGPAVLVMVENCAVPMALVDRVADRLAERTDLDRERFTVCVTHTHNGPIVRNALPYHFGEPMPEAHQERIDEYTRRLTNAIERAALKALEDRSPARLAWAEGEVSFAVNRRVIRDGQWAGFGVNPEGPVDHDLPLLRVTAPDGSLKALLVSYACHCTTFGGAFNRIHGDWAGSTMKILEDRHPEAAALVAIGCGGDQNPEPRGGDAERMMASARAHGRAVADEVDRLLEGKMHPVADPPECQLRRIDLPYEEVPSRDRWERWAERDNRLGFYARSVVKRLERGESLPESLPYPVQTWRFGEDLGMVFLAGEVVVDYSLRLKRELDGERLWVNAYANGVPCYIPSERIMPEGGYEVESSQWSYGRPSRFAHGIEDRIVRAVKDMLPERFAEPGNDSD